MQLTKMPVLLRAPAAASTAAELASIPVKTVTETGAAAAEAALGGAPAAANICG